MSSIEIAAGSLISTRACKWDQFWNPSLQETGKSGSNTQNITLKILHIWELSQNFFSTTYSVVVEIFKALKMGKVSAWQQQSWDVDFEVSEKLLHLSSYHMENTTGRLLLYRLSRLLKLNKLTFMTFYVLYNLQHNQKRGYILQINTQKRVEILSKLKSSLFSENVLLLSIKMVIGLILEIG